MSDFVLHRTGASGDLLPVRILPLLTRWRRPQAMFHGQELRLALELDLEDDAATGFVLDFASQGARVEATVIGAGAAPATWAFHALAAATRTDLLVDGQSTKPTPAELLPPAIAYLERYESEVLSDRRECVDLDGNGLVAWLAREELLLGEPGPFADLPLDDAARAYELLLESDAIEDLFISERDLTRLIHRFHARTAPDDD